MRLRRSIGVLTAATAIVAALAPGLAATAAAPAAANGPLSAHYARLGGHLTVDVRRLHADRPGMHPHRAVPLLTKDAAAYSAAKTSQLPSSPARPGKPFSTPTPGVAPGTSLPSGQPINLVTFYGIVEADQVAQFGLSQAIEPPDTQIAAGPGFALEMVNATGSIFTKAGVPVKKFDLNAFYNVQAGFSFRDPRVFYDLPSGRFIASGMSFDAALNGILYLAMSRTSDPGGTWDVYTNLPGPPPSTNVPVFFDQPKVGASTDKIVLSWQDYDCMAPASCNFQGQETRVIEKAQVMSGASQPTVAWFGPDATRFGLMPALEITPSATAYLVYRQSLSIQSVLITGTPASGNVVWSEQSNSVSSPDPLPPDAQQPDGGPLLATGDGRILSAVWGNGALWFTNNTACTFTGDTVTRACATLAEVSTDPTVGRPPPFEQAFGQAAAYTYYPAVSLDPSGNPVLVFTESSLTMYPSVVTLQGTGLPTPAALTLWNGGASYDFSGCGGTNQWGDYSGAAVDPTDASHIWVAGEYAVSATDPCDWGTSISLLKTRPVPSVTNLSPNGGGTAGGTPVRLTGSGFGQATSVTFGNVPAAGFSVDSDTQITATSPASPGFSATPWAVHVIVTTPAGSSANQFSNLDMFIYNAPQPVVTGVSPSSGSTAGGDFVTVTGSGFTAANYVSFGQGNDVPRSSFLSNTDTKIVLPTPGAPPGTVDVVVATAGGGSAAVAADRFSFMAPVGGAPGSISTFAGGSLGTGKATSVAHSPAGLALFGSRLYIADSGLNFPYGAIHALDLTTGDETLVTGTGTSGFSGDGGPASLAQVADPAGLAVDGSGNLFFADTHNQRIREINAATGVISTVAGSSLMFGFGGDGGPATQALLYNPIGIALDSAGNLYIADSGNNRVRKITAGTGIITTVAGNGTPFFSGDGGQATQAALNYPEAVSVDALGNLFIADFNNARIRKVDSAGIITTVAGNGSAGFSGDGGAATAAGMSPAGIFVDGSANLWISDVTNGRVREVDHNSGIITTAAGGGSAGLGDGGPAMQAQLTAPDVVVRDSSNNLYIGDQLQPFGYRVRMVDSTGKITTIAGTGNRCGSAGDGGPAAAAQLCQPNGVAVDPAGSVFIADTANNRIRRVAVDGTISTYAGTGVAGFSGDNGPATSAALMGPQQLVADASGNVFIADTGNNRVREVDTAGKITTVAGGGVAGVTLNGPTGLAFDSSGSLFIADTGDQKVLKLAGGVITVVAGTGVQGSAGDGGPATGAQLNNPMGLAVDRSGNLDIADLGNARVRQVSGNTGIITTITGNLAIQGGILAQSLAISPSGNLLVGDNIHVWQLMPGGWLVAVAGSSPYVPLGDGGPARSASLLGTPGLAFDKNGNLLIAENENGRDRIRRVTPAVIPGGPTNVTVTPGIGTANVSWVLPYDGGTSVVTYTVTPYNMGIPRTPKVVTGPTAGDSPIPTSVTISGLSHGSYTFVVAATNTVGSGPSGSSSQGIITSPPGPPTGVTATPRDGAAFVTWTAPADDGGSPITAYIVTSAPADGVAGTLGAISTKVPGLIDGTTYTFTVQAVSALGTGPASVASNPVTPFAGSYHSLPPARIIDTRPQSQVGPVGSPFGPHSTLNVQITGKGGVPSSGVSAAVLNVTVTNTTAASYLTVYPAGAPRPFASNLNWTAGTTTPNLVEVALGTDGQISVFNAAGEADVIIDVQGYVGVTANSTGRDGLFNPLVPVRLLDTRNGTGTNGVVAPLGQQATLSLQVAGRGGVPSSGVSAVVLNVTETQPSAGSYLTVFPSDVQPRPFASNLNFVAGQTVPNRVIVKLGADGKVNIFNAAGSVHVIADVNGWFTDGTSAAGGSHFVGINPHRLLDTREPGFGPLGPQATGTLQLTGPGANQVTAVVMNVTVTNPTAPSFLTLWPDGSLRPFASDLNYTKGLTVPNLVVVKLGPNATLDVFNAAGSTDVIMDLVGYYGAAVPAPAALRLVPFH